MSATMTTTEHKFAIRNLGVLNYSNGFTLWVYKCGEAPLEAVAVDNFFADANDMIAVGDMIIATGRNGCTLRCVTHADHGEVYTAKVG